jgi:hypothetical protein
MNAALRIVLSITALALGAVAVFALIERSSVAERAAERRALLARDAALNGLALAPGSALACLDAGAGEAVENACEKLVFASPRSTAAAVAYMEARLKLLADAAGAAGTDLQAELASTRRAVALDRYGIAAHVLATRDGCTADKCAAFSLVDDASALKANLKAEVFDQYVSRYVADWNAPPAAKAPVMSAAPAPAPMASVPAPIGGVRATAAVKPGEHWDFPSAASIPPVSIMNTEPPLPQGANAQAQAAAPPAAGAQPPAPQNPPIPPKRPAAQAAPPPAR